MGKRDCGSGAKWDSELECCVPETPTEGAVVVDGAGRFRVFTANKWASVAPYQRSGEFIFDPRVPGWVRVDSSNHAPVFNEPVVVNSELPRDVL